MKISDKEFAEMGICRYEFVNSENKVIKEVLAKSIEQAYEKLKYFFPKDYCFVQVRKKEQSLTQN